MPLLLPFPNHGRHVLHRLPPLIQRAVDPPLPFVALHFLTLARSSDAQASLEEPRLLECSGFLTRW